jgi:hypothetical protein
MMKESNFGTTLCSALEQIKDKLWDLRLPFHFCHGDFVPWNALGLGRQTFLFDWEYSRRLWLPGFDLFHFLIQTRLLLGKTSLAHIYRDVLEKVTRSQDIRMYWERLEIEKRNVRFLLLLYLLDRVIYHGCLNPGQYHALRQTLVLSELCLAETGLLP